MLILLSLSRRGRHFLVELKMEYLLLTDISLNSFKSLKITPDKISFRVSVEVESSFPAKKNFCFDGLGFKGCFYSISLFTLSRVKVIGSVSSIFSIASCGTLNKIVTS